MAKLKLDKVETVIVNSLNEVYEDLSIRKVFKTGSTARVFLVEICLDDAKKVSVQRVIKVFRHDGEFSKYLKPKDVFINEVAIIAGLADTNVMAIYDAGQIVINGKKKTEKISIPYYVMEYLPDALDLDKYIEKHREQLTSDSIIDLLIQSAKGLEALHCAGVVHCDVKYGNLLVGQDGRVKVADLGFSKRIGGGTQKTVLYTTYEPLPQKYKTYLTYMEDKRQAVAKIPRNMVDATFDLHYLSWIIDDLLDEENLRTKFRPIDADNLRLIARRANLDKKALLPDYKSAKSVIRDLQKMRGEYINRAGVPELNRYTGRATVRISVSGSIPFTERVEAIVSHPLFLRLHHAKQLGLTYLVFPGSQHSRFEHSLGVFSNVSRYIGSLLADDYNPFFRQIVDEEKISTTLLAGLIHDIGQHSFAHSLEDIGLGKSHEQIAMSFITGDQLDQYVNPVFLERGDLGEVISRFWPEIDHQRLQWLLSGDRSPGMKHDVGWQIMRAILSGPIDADKADYLLRDALHAGVEYARSIDITRFMNSLSASVYQKRTERPQGVLAFTWKGAQSAENLILARSQMFWVLYWHHTVRSAHAMLAHACRSDQVNADIDRKKAFKHVLYCGSIGELLAFLEGSSVSRTQELAKMLRVRRIFKRGISLDYSDSPDLYNSLMTIKTRSERKGDNLLLGLAEEIAEAINREVGGGGAYGGLAAEDVIVDIPRPEKDRLGRIYWIPRNGSEAEEYRSRGLAGNHEDWQDRVRTVRIFLNPRIDRERRAKISENGLDVLESLF